MAKYRLYLGSDDKDLVLWLDSLPPRARSRWVREALLGWRSLGEMLGQICRELQVVSVRQERLEQEVGEARKDLVAIKAVLESAGNGFVFQAVRREEKAEASELEAKIDGLTQIIEKGWDAS